jgi:hypothetical protein
MPQVAVDLDPQKMIDTFGQKYRAGIIKREDLIFPLYAQSKFDEGFTTITLDETQKDSVIVDLKDARFQQFSTEFLELGGMDFTPNEIKIYEIMLDTAQTPDKIRKTAVQFLLNKDNLDRSQSPILAVFLEAYLTASLYNLHKKEAFKGKEAPKQYDAGGKLISSPEGGLMDGFGTYLRKLTSNPSTSIKKPSVIPGFLTMPTTPVEHVEFIEDMYDMLDDEMKDNIDCFMVSRRFEEQYLIGKDIKYNSTYAKTGVDNSLHLRNGRVCGSIDQNGTNLVWFTTKVNAIKVISNFGNVGNWKVGLKDLKKVQATSDYGLGYGLLDPSRCMHNGNYTGLPAL